MINDTLTGIGYRWVTEYRRIHDFVVIQQNTLKLNVGCVIGFVRVQENSLFIKGIAHQ